MFRSSSSLHYLVTLLAVLLSQSTVVKAVNWVDPQCYLCKDPSEQVKRWNYIFPNGKTCMNYYLDANNILSTNAQCAQIKAGAQAACCNAAEPAVASQAAPSPIQTYSGPVGNEPRCPICRTDEYPGLPNGFIVARYVGEFFCKDLYGRGLHGMIPDFMCGPLQDFAAPVCGCGVYNPNGTGRAPTPAVTPQPPTGGGASLTATPRASPASTNNGLRKLRGGAAASADAEEKDEEEQEEELVPPAPTARQLTAEDMHFSTRALTEEELKETTTTSE